MPDTSNEYDADAALPTPVGPTRALDPLCVEELLNVAIPVAERDVAVSVCMLVLPDVCVRLPPTVRLPSVPTDVSEQLAMLEPNVVDDSTWLPPT